MIFMKKMKLFAAALVCLTMALSPLSAFGTPVPTPMPALVGTSSVLEPIVTVLLPTAPAIRLNPLQVGGTTANPQPRIWSPWYVIANRGNTPVDITLGVTPRIAGTATLVANAGLATPNNDNATAWLNVTWSNAPTGTAARTNAQTAVQLQGLPWEAGTGTAVQTLGTAGEAVTHRIRLDARAHTFNEVTGVTTWGAPNMTTGQYVAFALRGEINPRATWGTGATANTVTADLVFTITPVSPVGWVPALAEHTAVDGVERVLRPDA